MIEELDTIKDLLLMRGLESVTIRDPYKIVTECPELAAIKSKVDTLVIKALTRPRRSHGGPRRINMDTFSN